jgi:uncharacterized protein YkwD
MLIVIAPKTEQSASFKLSEAITITQNQLSEAQSPNQERVLGISNQLKPQANLKIQTQKTQNKITATPKQNCTGNFSTSFLCLLNQYREQNKKTKLSNDSALASVALAHSTWMFNTNTFSHIGLNGSRLGERCSSAGTTCFAENIAKGFTSSQHLLTMWQNSPSHNQHLLGNYTSIGLGIKNNYADLLFR